MIKLNGTATRIFTFPSDAESALRFFSDLNRVAYYLPHIAVVEEYGANRMRVHYQSVELGAYTINIFADIESRVNDDELAIYIVPIEDTEETPTAATLNATTGHGRFTSVATFFDEGDGQTTIEYNLSIVATLPRPRGLRMMPGRVVNRIAQSISQGRVNEIADGFMATAIDAFPGWLAKYATTK